MHVPSYCAENNYTAKAVWTHVDASASVRTRPVRWRTFEPMHRSTATGVENSSSFGMSVHVVGRGVTSTQRSKQELGTDPRLGARHELGDYCLVWLYWRGEVLYRLVSSSRTEATHKRLICDYLSNSLSLTSTSLHFVHPVDGAKLHHACAEMYIPEKPASSEESKSWVAQIDRISLSTLEKIAGRDIEREVEIITAECVFGMNIFRDFFAGISDFFGGRSEASQKVLRDARQACLNELKAEAWRVGADAVVGIRLDYSEISGKGKGMLFLVASGTAFKLVSDEHEAPVRTKD